MVIARTMAHNPLADQLATCLLSFLLLDRKGAFNKLKAMLSGKRDVIIFAASPLLEDVLRETKEEIRKSSSVKIAADKAASTLRLYGLIPDVITTDLDGNLVDILTMDRKGAVIVVHAHGDNIDKVLRYARMIRHVVGSTQVIPLPKVRNFGGYTDGDRGVFLARSLGAGRIFLVGFEPESTKNVKKKFFIGLRLIEWLCEGERDIYVVSPRGHLRSAKGIRVTEFKELLASHQG